MPPVMKTIRDRKSVRKFLDQQLLDEDIQLILEAGIHAPSGHNCQSVYYTVVQNKELITKMDELSKEEMKKSEVDWIAKFGNHPRYQVLHSAPTVIIVSAKDSCYSPVEDSSASIQNMMIAAESLGIGSVWVGLIDHYLKLDVAKADLNIPDGYTARYAVCLGYESKEKSRPKPERKFDVVSWIK